LVIKNFNVDTGYYFSFLNGNRKINKFKIVWPWPILNNKFKYDVPNHTISIEHSLRKCKLRFEKQLYFKLPHVQNCPFHPTNFSFY
jgi:hypothetical protein